MLSGRIRIDRLVQYLINKKCTFSKSFTGMTLVHNSWDFFLKYQNFRQQKTLYHSGLLDGTFCKLDIWIVVLKSRSIKPILSLVSFMIIVNFNVKGRLLICTSYDVLVKRFRSSLQYQKTNSLKMGRMLSNVFLAC